MPNTSLAEAVDYLGMVSGAQEPQKLSVAQLETTVASKVDAPIINQCPINLECRLVETLALGSHSWFVGEVMEVQVTQDVLDEEGNVDTKSLDPLIYLTSDSHYHAVGEPIGKAFSMGKKLQK